MSLIALGVTGGIGAYKAVEIARGLQKARPRRRGRHDARPRSASSAPSRSRPSPGARSSPTSGRRAPTPTSSTSRSRPIDLLLVAPATANTLGKFAHGLADDFLTSLYLATRRRC
jgi:phosphopantothenoylcysteine decarboxylase / phosphopantothenate---cysteine ligase